MKYTADDLGEMLMLANQAAAGVDCPPEHNQRALATAQQCAELLAHGYGYSVLGRSAPDYWLIGLEPAALEWLERQTR